MVTCAGCPYGTFGQRTGIQRSSVPPIYTLNYWTLNTEPQTEAPRAPHYAQRRRPIPGTPPLRKLRALCGRGALFVEEAAGLVGVDRDAWGHGRGEGDLLQVPALGGGRLEPNHLVKRGRVVFEQRLLVEGRLSDDG